MEEMNSAILDIAKYLRQRNQTAIKFLCDDIISDEKLIQCKNGTDLILLIKKEGLFSNDNMDFLIDLLNNIPRKDLISI